MIRTNPTFNKYHFDKLTLYHNNNTYFESCKTIVFFLYHNLINIYDSPHFNLLLTEKPSSDESGIGAPLLLNVYPQNQKSHLDLQNQNSPHLNLQNQTSSHLNLLKQTSPHLNLNNETSLHLNLYNQTSSHLSLQKQTSPHLINRTRLLFILIFRSRLLLI